MCNSKNQRSYLTDYKIKINQYLSAWLNIRTSIFVTTVWKRKTNCNGVVLIQPKAGAGKVKFWENEVRIQFLRKEISSFYPEHCILAMPYFFQELFGKLLSEIITVVFPTENRCATFKIFSRKLLLYFTELCDYIVFWHTMKYHFPSKNVRRYRPIFNGKAKAIISLMQQMFQLNFTFEVAAYWYHIIPYCVNIK